MTPKQVFFTFTSKTDSIPSSLEDKIFYSEWRDVQDFHFKRENSPLTVKFVIEGKENYIVNNSQSFNLCPGNFLIINENEDVECLVKANSATRGLSIFFSHELIQNVFSVETGQSPDTPLPSDLNIPRFILHQRNCSSNQFGNGLYHIHDAIEHSDCDELFYEQLLYQLAASLVRHSLEEENNIVSINAVKRSTQVEIYARVMKGIDYIHDNFSQEMSLEEMANNATLSKYHFLRSFKKITGLSPYKYLQNLRLNKSKEMLLKGYSSSHVAATLKFNDLSYFSNEFMKYFGFRPSQISRNTQIAV